MSRMLWKVSIWMVGLYALWIFGIQEWLNRDASQKTSLPQRFAAYMASILRLKSGSDSQLLSFFKVSDACPWRSRYARCFVGGRLLKAYSTFTLLVKRSTVALSKGDSAIMRVPRGIFPVAKIPLPFPGVSLTSIRWRASCGVCVVGELNCAKSYLSWDHLVSIRSKKLLQYAYNKPSWQPLPIWFYVCVEEDGSRWW